MSSSLTPANIASPASTGGARAVEEFLSEIFSTGSTQRVEIATSGT